MPRKNFAQGDHYSQYEPALYKLIKTPEALHHRESLTQMQEHFIGRTDKLLRMHQHRAHIHDGLKSLTDM